MKKLLNKFKSYKDYKDPDFRKAVLQKISSYYHHQSFVQKLAKPFEKQAVQIRITSTPKRARTQSSTLRAKASEREGRRASLQRRRSQSELKEREQQISSWFQMMGHYQVQKHRKGILQKLKNLLRQPQFSITSCRGIKLKSFPLHPLDQEAIKQRLFQLLGGLNWGQQLPRSVSKKAVKKLLLQSKFILQAFSIQVKPSKLENELNHFRTSQVQWMCFYQFKRLWKVLEMQYRTDDTLLVLAL